jgi:16S rRNA A1518/A1519 N6-dimethyltransferase RsmA/KsgA/DIM1 with predicted DNA glycosylase/AP lyase activity
MPYSYPLYKEEVKAHFLNNISRNTKILDVGAGCGTYSNLLKADYPNMDGIEIFEGYVEQFNLKSLYNNLFIADILDFDFDGYDYLIMGDILEHIPFIQAKNLLDKITQKRKMCLVAVPYKYEQGEEFGNIYETHHQPDLTKEVFLKRYSQMQLLCGDDNYGYFLNYDFL